MKDYILGVLESAAFTFTSEADLQAGLQTVLSSAGLPVEREVALSPADRIDFLVDRVGIEVKTQGSWIAVTKQCQRYAASDRLDSLIIVTNKASHLACPSAIGGKPLTVHFLGGRRM